MPADQVRESKVEIFDAKVEAEECKGSMRI